MREGEYREGSGNQTRKERDRGLKMAGIEAVKKEQSLPEVPLKWADFMWSLEKLRHKPYSKKTSER